ncbi:hypothetical protein ACJZ2D_009912 [Fusarium nematophilum]
MKPQRGASTTNSNAGNPILPGDGYHDAGFVQEHERLGLDVLISPASTLGSETRLGYHQDQNGCLQVESCCPGGKERWRRILACLTHQVFDKATAPDWCVEGEALRTVNILVNLSSRDATAQVAHIPGLPGQHELDAVPIIAPSIICMRRNPLAVSAVITTCRRMASGSRQRASSIPPFTRLSKAHLCFPEWNQVAFDSRSFLHTSSDPEPTEQTRWTSQ